MGTLESRLLVGRGLNRSECVNEVLAGETVTEMALGPKLGAGSVA